MRRSKIVYGLFLRYRNKWGSARLPHVPPPREEVLDTDVWHRNSHQTAEPDLSIPCRRCMVYIFQSGFGVPMGRCLRFLEPFRLLGVGCMWRPLLIIPTFSPRFLNSTHSDEDLSTAMNPAGQTE